MTTPRSAHADAIYRYRIVEILRVVDADTIDLVLSLGFGIRGSFRFRLHDVDAPEIYGRNATDEGQEAQRFVIDWLDGRWDGGRGRLHALTFPASGATVGIGDGAFGRWLVEIVDVDSGERLTDALRAQGWG